MTLVVFFPEKRNYDILWDHILIINPIVKRSNSQEIVKKRFIWKFKYAILEKWIFKFLRTVYDDAINRDDSDLISNEEVKI